MRNIVMLLFLMCLNSLSWGQCKETTALKIGGDFKNTQYIAHCPTYNYKYSDNTWKQEHSNSKRNLNIENELSETKKSLEATLLDKIGDDLFSKLKLESVSISVYDSISKMTSRYPPVDMYRCKTKYFFYYHLMPTPDVQFCIGIALDDYRKIISELPFPEEASQKTLDPTLNVCKAVAIAKASGVPITPVESVFFDFNYERKEFFWIVRQKINNPVRGVNAYNEITIEAADGKQVTPYRKTVQIN